MADDRTKIEAKAQKFIQKAQYDKAVQELEKLVAQDPKDVRTKSRIGDLYVKMGREQDAVQLHRTIAQGHESAGFNSKALAIYKHILEYAPEDAPALKKVGELLNLAGQNAEAVRYFASAGAIYESRGELSAAEDTLSLATALAPDDPEARLLMGTVLSRLQRNQEAAEDFAIAAKGLRSQGRIEASIKAAERAVHFDRDRHVELAEEVGRYYLETRPDPNRAAGYLRICYKRGRVDGNTVNMMGEALSKMSDRKAAEKLVAELIAALDGSSQHQMAEQLRMLAGG